MKIKNQRIDNIDNDNNNQYNFSTILDNHTLGFIGYCSGGNGESERGGQWNKHHIDIIENDLYGRIWRGFG